MELAGKVVLVIGAAKSGLAAARFLAGHGSVVVLSDIKLKHEFNAETQRELQELVSLGVSLSLGGQPDLGVIKPELLIVSPGVPMDIPPILEARHRDLTVWGEMELAARFNCAPIVAVTGTNGKTTTTALIGQMMADAGRDVFVGGNIGTPFITRAEELKPSAVAVLEASSFQLETTETFKPNVAIILNLTPDHVERHGSFAGYIEAKAKIFANQDQSDWLILNDDDAETRLLASLAPSRVISFSRLNILREGFCVVEGFITARMEGRSIPIIKADDLLIKGGHNLENALAAAAAGWVTGIPASSLAYTLGAFQGVPHRLEPVLTHKGVRYINDSKGTNVDASIKALEAYPDPIVLIAGGKGKGTSYAPFAEKIKEKVKHLVLVGKAAGEIEEAMKSVGYDKYEHARDFRDAVEKASRAAAAGDIVLLSPACASYDMFNNFEERGEVFKTLVRELAADR